MTPTEFLTSYPVILLAGLASAYWVYLHKNKRSQILAWERKHIWVHFDRLKARICRFIRSRLKSNARIMAWLNKPAKHGKPDADFIVGQIKVFGDVWK